MLKLTKTGIGLLTRQYRSVLHKCWAINVGIFSMLGKMVSAATHALWGSSESISELIASCSKYACLDVTGALKNVANNFISAIKLPAAPLASPESEGTLNAFNVLDKSPVSHLFRRVLISSTALVTALVLQPTVAGATYYQNDNMVWIVTNGTSAVHSGFRVVANGYGEVGLKPIAIMNYETNNGGMISLSNVSFTRNMYVNYDYISFSGNTSLSYDGFKLNGSGNATGIDFGSTSAYQTDAMKHLATTGSVADTLNNYYTKLVVAGEKQTSNVITQKKKTVIPDLIGDLMRRPATGCGYIINIGQLPTKKDCHPRPDRGSHASLCDRMRIYYQLAAIAQRRGRFRNKSGMTVFFFEAQ